MYLPTTKQELNARGWDQLDIIIISGDTYIDSPYSGEALIGKYLTRHGFRVGVISQPNVTSGQDITRLGEPRLFWGVTAGSVDSMVANYTATGKKRKSDDFTPSGQNTRRPDRALIAYTNLIKKYFKHTAPIVLGGIEASLRRIAHYDFWSGSVRRSVLLDAKADLLLYGMAEHSALSLAQALQAGEDYHATRGLCYMTKETQEGYLELPSYEDAKSDKNGFLGMFQLFYANNDPVTAKGLLQRYDNRFLVLNPPTPALLTEELDEIYALAFERDAHPYYKQQGIIRALDTIQFSVTSHRGCVGECNFCSIAVHQGRKVQSRSKQSIINEIKELTLHKQFKGIINDIGGPTANMYDLYCEKMAIHGACQEKRCLFPAACPSLRHGHAKQQELLAEIKEISGVKKVFISSGIRYDMIMTDTINGLAYLECIIKDHISGQMKIAPEHSARNVLVLMGKPGIDDLSIFKKEFDRLNKKHGKQQFLTYYFIAAYPGCTITDMRQLAHYIKDNLKLKPEQVQIFTPTPSTYASLMYYCEINPWEGDHIFVEKLVINKEEQKNALH